MIITIDPTRAQQIGVKEITKRQLFLQLEEDGNTDQWNALMVSLSQPGNERAKTLWETATGLTITDATVQSFAISFGYTEDDLQTLWNSASSQ